jgi:tetratricopeptide (TPR) repeat protein
MKPTAVVLAVFAAFASLPVAAQDSEQPSTITLTLPSLTWALKIPATGFRMERPRMLPSPDSRSIFTTNKHTGVTLSAYLEKAPKPGSAKDCREYYWPMGKQSSVPKEGIKLSEADDKAIVEYTVPEAMGQKLDQRNVNVYLAEDGYWMDVHVSKAAAKPEDEKMFREIIRGIRIERNYTPTTADLVGFGAIHSLRQEHAKAIPFYEKALEKEKTAPTLDRDAWKSLVNQLGLSYGMSGDAKKAKDIYEWGIKREPQYPMFYYNLACACAEVNDKEGALRNLKLAFQYKQNMLPDEKMDDPREDPSFSKCLKDAAFAAELAKLKQ